MKNFRKKWVSSMLAAMLVFAMIVSNIPGLAYAQQDGEPEQATEAVSAVNAAETAVITAPNQLSFDGSKNYAILTKCAGGNHTYGIGPDAAITAELGISGKNLAPGNTINLSQEGLGWSLKKSGDDLIISNIFARGGYAI